MEMCSKCFRDATEGVGMVQAEQPAAVPSPLAEVAQLESAILVPKADTNSEATPSREASAGLEVSLGARRPRGPGSGPPVFVRYGSFTRVWGVWECREARSLLAPAGFPGRVAQARDSGLGRRRGRQEGEEPEPVFRGERVRGLPPRRRLAPSGLPNPWLAWCPQCRKKVGLVGGFECKCGYVFCSSHRMPDEHNCAYGERAGGPAMQCSASSSLPALEP